MAHKLLLSACLLHYVFPFLGDSRCKAPKIKLFPDFGLHLDGKEETGPMLSAVGGNGTCVGRHIIRCLLFWDSNKSFCFFFFAPRSLLVTEHGPARVYGMDVPVAAVLT